MAWLYASASNTAHVSLLTVLLPVIIARLVRVLKLLTLEGIPSRRHVFIHPDDLKAKRISHSGLMWRTLARGFAGDPRAAPQAIV